MTTLTPLQQWSTALIDCLHDARAELDEHAWAVFLSIACDRIGILAAHVLLAEILEDGREQQEDVA